MTIICSHCNKNPCECGFVHQKRRWETRKERKKRLHEYNKKHIEKTRRIQMDNKPFYCPNQHRPCDMCKYLKRCAFTREKIHQSPLEGYWIPNEPKGDD